MIDWVLILAGASTTAAIALGIERFRLSLRLRRLGDRHEALGDEIWEVHDAVEARQRAEAASAAKSRFLATVSHEIRTPLNGILGMADLLAGTTLDREQAAYVEAVKTSGRALATLIDEILDFSRIEAGRLDLAAEAFDLAALVEGVVELLAPRAQDKGLEIAARIDPRFGAVMGDPVRLRQVLTNLAGNAVKFTDAGGVGVTVDWTARDRARFTVADTGCGVPPAQRHTIFEEFETGSARAGEGGTGLGLAISRRIVERMGGKLTLTDRVGGGSLFSFEIALPAAEPRGAAAAHAWPDLGSQTALIVADSPFQAPYLAAHLRAAGAEVAIVPDVAAGLDRLAADPPVGVIFVDCALGEALTGRLAEAARAGGVRRSFLLFSPYERRAFGQSLASGFDGWLVKPVRARSLAARLGGARSGRTGDNVTRLPLPAPARGQLRVLLAEDNEINRIVAVNFLQRLGAEVVHAADGPAALALALDAIEGRAPRFDTVLMDVSMPGLDGLDVTRRIRAAEAERGCAPLFILALTAYAFPEDRDACLAAGLDGVLTKPLDLSRLAAALGRQGLRPAG